LATGLSVSSKISRALLKKEIALANKLEINYIVTHAGSAKGHEKEEGIKALAKILNGVLKSESAVKILIENTAHGNRAICSDLCDFIELKKLIKSPEKIGFCLDTAHAFSYGYDIAKTDDFVTLLDQTMGIENIKLIHLNDSAEPHGSKLDKHEVPGKGLIGKKTLQKLINHDKLKDIPIIIEPPQVEIKEIEKIINQIKKW
jgi:deoxyribonuclease-4